MDRRLLVANGEGIWRWREMRRALLACLLCCTAPIFAHAVTIDGVIEDSEWESALTFDDFRVVTPRTFEVPPYRTVLRILPAREALYVSMWMECPKDKRTRGKSARDTPTAGDPAYLHIDFEGLGRTAYEFTVSISGAQRDSAILNQSQFVTEWDAVWYSAVSEDEDGWSAEFQIPWTTAPLGRSDEARRTIGIFAGRYLKATAQAYGTPGIMFPSATYVQDFRKVELPRYESSALDVLPYASALHDLESSSTTAKTGFDLLWLPNERHRVGATVNPDFAQVESDELVVNFSAIETFFSDRRPFFTERLELFDIRIPEQDRLIHTRRIGSAPDRGGPEPADITAALKYTGSLGSHEIGAFAATEDSSANSAGRTFVASRWRYKGDILAVGYLGTFVDRPAVERQAQVHAVDFDWRLNAAASIRGQVIGSRVTQASRAQPDGQGADGDHTNDLGGWLELNYQTSGGSWQRLTARSYGEAFSFNDLGYQERTGFRSLTSETEIAYTPSGVRAIQSATSNLEISMVENSAGTELREKGTFLQKLVWTQGATTTAELTAVASGIDDLFARGNGYTRLPAWRRIGLKHESAQTGRWRLSGEVATFQEGVGSARAWKGMSEATLLLQENLILSLKFDYIDSPDWLAWLRSTELASFKRQQLYGLFGVDWYPHRRHEFRLRAQWITLSARPVEAFQLSDSGFLQSVARPEPNLSTSTVALQLRYRYEFAPMSQIYIVYSRGGYYSSVGIESDLGDRFALAWDSVSSQQIAAKVTYRF